jgi:hypothetical protein
LLVSLDKCLLMGQSGRSRVATEAERAEVRRLAAEQASVRQIAEQVFGDRRFRGRVERILQTPADREEAVAGVPFDEMSVSAETVPTVRLALARYRRLPGHLPEGRPDRAEMKSHFWWSWSSSTW